MAPPDRKTWYARLLGALLVALGGAMLGSRNNREAARSGPPSAASARPRKSAAPRLRKGRGRPSHILPPVSAKAVPAPARAAATAAPRQGDSTALGYEVADTKPGTIGIVMLVSVLIIASSIAGLFAMIGHFRARDRLGPPLTAEQRSLIVPPGPPLQARPLADIATLRKREDDLLNGYGWVDPAHTRARIPIDRAIALVIGKPLDPAPPAPAPAAEPKP